MICTGNGWACPSCYYREHPFVAKTSFQEVLVNCDDQVLVRQLLEAYVPTEAKRQITQEFNLTMAIRHNRRVKLSSGEDSD